MKVLYLLYGPSQLGSNRNQQNPPESATEYNMQEPNTFSLSLDYPKTTWGRNVLFLSTLANVVALGKIWHVITSASTRPWYIGQTGMMAHLEVDSSEKSFEANSNEIQWTTDYTKTAKFDVYHPL